MNKIKENKLNSIKLQLNEINEFVKVKVNDEIQKTIDDSIDNKENDTLILTKIVNIRDKEENTIKIIDEISLLVFFFFLNSFFFVIDQFPESACFGVHFFSSYLEKV